VGTLLWVAVSLGFKLYVTHVTDYNASYGAVGAVIVLLLWFSGLAILVGAELNAEIEHASPHGKDPGEKVPGQKRKIGLAAARAYRDRLQGRTSASDERRVLRWPEPGASRPQTASESTSDNTSTRTDTRFTMTTRTDQRSLGDMFADLSRDTKTLIEQEVRLARIELTDAMSRVRRSAILLAAGGFLAYAGLLAAIAAVVLVLIEFGLSPWVGALLGGAVVAGAGLLLIRSGLAGLQQQLAPRETIDTLKEDARWLKSQVR
jgi:hypothetical protein